MDHRTVELSRRSVVRDLLYFAKSVTRVTVGFSDLFCDQAFNFSYCTHAYAVRLFLLFMLNNFSGS
jgi:hypothetical protein